MTHTTTGRRTAAAASTARMRLAAAAAAFVLLPGLLAACSAGSPETDASKTSGGKDKGVSLSECMRGKGYEMDDAAVGGQGNSMQLSAPDGVDKDQWTADLEKCMGPMTGAGDSDGSGTKNAKPGPGGAAKEKEYVECLRDHGFADYPDDVEARGSYQPDDEDAFADVTETCDRKVFDAPGTAGKS